MKISLQNREFRLWKFSISHSMLLIRSCKNAFFSNNIDLYFADVKLIKFHQFFCSTFQMEENTNGFMEVAF